MNKKKVDVGSLNFDHKHLFFDEFFTYIMRWIK